MTSKQEKLAAARKRLKEFQGKSKVELSKPRVDSVSSMTVSAPTVLTHDSSYDSVNKRPSLSGSEDLMNCQSSIQPHEMMQHTYRETPEQNDHNHSKTPASLFIDGNSYKFQLGCNNDNQNLRRDNSHGTGEEGKIVNSVYDHANGLKVDLVESVGKNNCDTRNCSGNESEDLILLERHNERNLDKSDNPYITCMEAKKFFDSEVSSKNPLNDTIISLQKELQSHAQTIAILVQQRNDAQIALSKSHNLLEKKSGEADELGQQIATLTHSVNSLTQRLFEAEAVIQKLNLEKEECLHKWNESRSLADNFQAQLDKTEEELQETKRKYKEKMKDCEQFLIGLQEAQAQLSFYQIQQQQNSSEGQSGPSAQVAELQNENVNLKKKVEELERKVEAERAEKDESSQKFHIYAQQCNSQLSSLNSQLKSLKIERENLSKENIILSKNLSEWENAREQTPKKSSEEEIAELSSQVNALSEENKRLNGDLKSKEEERASLENKMGEKELELNKLLEDLKELSEENKRLAMEVETPKANERLLAAMESDKVAAAKAVSQNQILKKQIVELEQAFIKLSKEKLELTNQLSHERHVSAELQTMLRNSRNGECGSHEQHECNHGEKGSQPLPNDSNEMEELRNIVRQLQDDKMELTARLNAYESNKRSEEKEEDSAENGSQCVNTKLLLQQMKEKVKKTMNEIAVLDEEKEKLEHLVLQLQGETETIGEYITLYQKQRMLLRQRAQEKDSQLLQLSRDKEELKSKLSALDELVQRLISERGTCGVSPVSKSADLNSSAQIPENTAGKIRALINEIGSTTLINNQSLAFEHCSCCSGRLITI